MDQLPIPRRTGGGIIPLSFAQQRLWFLEQFEGGSPVYNVPRILNLVGALDVPAMEKTLTEIVRRHESLRTTFRAGAGSLPRSSLRRSGFPFPSRISVRSAAQTGNPRR